MSDIVERLAVLEQFGFSQLGKAIKDEIERLHAELSDARLMIEGWRDRADRKADRDRRKYEAEIERLKVHNHHLECVIETQDAEIERLQAVLRQIIADATIARKALDTERLQP